MAPQGRTGLRPVPGSYNSFTEREDTLQKSIFVHDISKLNAMITELRGSNAIAEEPCADLVGEHGGHLFA